MSENSAGTTGLVPGDHTSLFIDGHAVEGAGGRFPTVDPATEEVLGTAADGTADDMDAAIASARTAFDTTAWRDDHALRARCLRQLHDALTADVERLRALTIAEVGAPRMLTSGAQLEAPLDYLPWYADLIESYAWTTDMGVAAPMGMRSKRRVEREAVGVVGAVTPWNFPHQINFAKVAPALAAGNTVVLKPAPDTPWCAAEIARIAHEHTDIPPGVFNVVTSSDHSVGAMLSSDPRVDLVSFTGSTATGRAVMTAAAPTLKKVFLELGGKSAFVVLDDADIASACSMAAFTVATHAGQGCAITTRLLVPRAHYDDAIAATRATMSSLTPGDPRDAGTVCGPLISQRQRDRVEGYIDLAVTEGGKIECGGRRPDGRDRGFFVEPTLISGLDNSARAAQEEIFGPVLVVLPHDGDEDAIRIANDSPYGLSGAVYGTDPARIDRVVRGIRTGTMGVNGGVWYGADVPFGGYKQSGIGREMGVAGFEEYLETKLVAELA
ncbi:aldehyde dehydrogenase [Rhodococcus sp. HNM0569]|uniref:aldehyde dehydrogenase n=1 Tax=Rhodococcus sp. HNM0569 TaxID=2716340 RepID=UPI00146C95F3|nr:aldehyde dehydrogenase [Rhodococcus sp. HNM0569]NLU83316.1 aldehyde dehydrogenase [Rhodococcus sp. HNM0569]